MSFRDATQVRRDGERFAADIVPGWDVGGNANGGYLMAIGARAMAEAAGRDPISLTAHFISPGRAGPVGIEVQTVKARRRFTTLRARVSGPDGVILELLGSFGDLQAMDGSSRIDAEPPVLPAPEDCVHLNPDDGAPSLMGNFDLCVHPEDAGFALGKPSGQPLFRGWFRLRDEAIDAFALILATDAFPPTVFNADLPIGWAPTVDMTTHIRAIPEPGWLRCRFSTRFISGGMLEEDGELWGADGRLLAQSRQLALLPRPS